MSPGLQFGTAVLNVGGSAGEPSVRAMLAVVELTPEDALGLAARLADVYGLHKRWLDARDRDPDAPMPEPRKLTGLDVESYRLHVLLESGYAVEDAEPLARNLEIDLHKAEQLAREAGPKLAAKILS